MKYPGLTLGQIEKVVDKLGGMAGIKFLLQGSVEMMPKSQAVSSESLAADENPNLPKKCLALSGHMRYGRRYLRPFSAHEAIIVTSFNASEPVRKILEALAASGNEPLERRIPPSFTMVANRMLDAHPGLSGRLATFRGCVQLWITELAPPN